MFGILYLGSHNYDSRMQDIDLISRSCCDHKKYEILDVRNGDGRCKILISKEKFVIGFGTWKHITLASSMTLNFIRGLESYKNIHIKFNIGFKVWSNFQIKIRSGQFIG